MYPVYRYTGKQTLCDTVMTTFIPQQQNRQPGYEYMMIPPPITENAYYQASQKLKNQVAIITGGDSGIGRAIALAYAKEGCQIVFTYLTETEDAITTEKMIRDLGSSPLVIPIDLTVKKNAEYVIEQTLKEFGQINILVNNQGIQFNTPDIENITEEQLLLVFQTNLFSYIYMIQAALPHLNEGACIINTAGAIAYQGSPVFIDASAASGGIVSLTRSLAPSLAKKKIRINGVAPGAIWTPLIPSSYSAKEVTTFGTNTEKTLLNRAGQPFEAASCYVFLASDDASFMTGQFLHPNGGLIMMS
ncbi:oxidoreductase, short chain dehydrogenase/reductase family [Lachnospiraceae bacterium KM106-2]|nr:oxidoreductase, short chain dehydrogenase/reductase family [Lachnospiraceae bacterium KM106-2]